MNRSLNMNEISIYDSISKQLEKQLSNFWVDINFNRIEKKIDEAYDLCMNCLSASYDKYLNPDSFSSPRFTLHHSGCWCIFLYYLSKCLAGNPDTLCDAEMVYYLNKILHNVDWYCEINLPSHFMVQHPLGSVLGRACYGDYLFIYQGVTVGGNASLNDGKLEYPTIGNNVALLSNAKVLGKCNIGNNVIVSANSYVINEDIPDNSIVFGSSPHLIIKRDEKKIENYMRRVWRYPSGNP